ncbi:MAG: hypothetical protein ACK55Z_06915 [bacterium]
MIAAWTLLKIKKSSLVITTNEDLRVALKEQMFLTKNEEINLLQERKKIMVAKNKMT